MKKTISWYQQSSLKVKWSFAAGAVIFFTFFLFSFFLYNAISQWLLNEEEDNVKQVLDELSIFYRQRGPVLTTDEINESRDLLYQINEKNQTIRILDLKGEEVLRIESEQKEDFYIPFFPVDKKTITMVQTDKQKVYIGRSPIRSREFNGYVEVIHPLGRYDTMMKNLFFFMSVIGLIGLLLSGLFGFVMARNFMKPIKKLTSTMGKIQRQGFQERMETGSYPAEIREMSAIFNEMMDKIERSFLSQKQFVEDASHELRTPIQILEGHLSLLNRWGKNDPDVMEESLKASIEEIKRIKRLVQELLDLSKIERDKLDNEDKPSFVLPVVEKVVANFELLHPDFTFNISQKGKVEHKTVKSNGRHIEQILIILLDNAVKYSDEFKEVNILVQETNQTIKLQVIDKGIGIPQKELMKIFDRFYRVDKARSRNKGGNGLGLAIAKELVEARGGKIEAESLFGTGTTVTIFFPFYQSNLPPTI
jgi:two-component system sensor histidine kinase ArlS